MPHRPFNIPLGLETRKVQFHSNDFKWSLIIISSYAFYRPRQVGSLRTLGHWNFNKNWYSSRQNDDIVWICVSLIYKYANMLSMITLWLDTDWKHLPECTSMVLTRHQVVAKVIASTWYTGSKLMPWWYHGINLLPSSCHCINLTPNWYHGSITDPFWYHGSITMPWIHHGSITDLSQLVMYHGSITDPSRHGSIAVYHGSITDPSRYHRSIMDPSQIHHCTVDPSCIYHRPIVVP